LAGVSANPLAGASGRRDSSSAALYLGVGEREDPHPSLLPGRAEKRGHHSMENT